MTIQSVKSSFNHSFKVLGKGIWRDLVNVRRYKIQLIGWLLNMSIGAGAGYLFSILFDFNPITTTETGLMSANIFVFFIGGIALNTFSDSALWAPSGRVINDIHYGTLEAVFVTPANRIAYFLSPILSDSLLNLIFFIPIYVLLMAINGTINNIYSIFTTLLVVLVTIYTMASLGILFAMLAILIRRIQALAGLLSMVFQFLCGAYVPVQSFIGINVVFGSILKYIACLFPYTYCYDLFRYFMFYENNYITIFPIWSEFLILGVSSIFFLFLAALLFKKVEKKAKIEGLAIL